MNFGTSRRKEMLNKVEKVERVKRILLEGIFGSKGVWEFWEGVLPPAKI